MPVATLSAARLRSLLAHPPSDLALDDILFASKAEVESRDGDDLTLSVTPDRLDLLSEAGLSLHIAGVTDAATGIPPIHAVPNPPSRVVEVDPSVDPLRPFISAVVVHAPEPSAGLDEGTLAEAIRFQELLHATIGRDRRAASLGIYPLYPCLYCNPYSPYPNCSTIAKARGVNVPSAIWSSEPEPCGGPPGPSRWHPQECATVPTELWQYGEQGACSYSANVDLDLSGPGFVTANYCFHVHSRP